MPDLSTSTTNLSMAASDVSMPAPTFPGEHPPFRELALDRPTLVAIGGSGTMQLRTFPHDEILPAAAPTATSMRVMETGLALVAIVVALLLNVWR